MSVKNVKKEQVTCTNCGHVMELNAWGIPTKHQSGDYMDAIERAIIRFENISKECNERDKKNNQKSSKKRK